MFTFSPRVRVLVGPFNPYHSSVTLSRMRAAEQRSSAAAVPASSSLGSQNGAASSGTAAPASSQVQAEETGQGESRDRDNDRSVEPQQQQINLASLPNFWMTEERLITDETWSCIFVVVTFWFFVSVTMMMGVYGTTSLRLGPSCSLLIQPNPLFTQFVKVEELNGPKPGPLLYRFYKPPPLNVVTKWSDTHSASIPAELHKKWTYFLNEGSQINVSYSVKSPSSNSVILAIAQGDDDLIHWLEDPSYPNTTFSWNIIHGTGMIQVDILKSSDYFVALSNWNLEEVEVQLNISTRAFMYNISDAYYKCNFTHYACILKLFFSSGNAIVLTSPDPEQGTSSDEWYVRLSYEPRWITYILGISGMTLLMLMAFHILKKFRITRQDEASVNSGEIVSERTTPLLSSHKDEDILSRGSSYDSLSQDEDDLEDGLTVGSLDGKSPKDSENNNTSRRLCAICFDAPRDCFFLPCGHCVACFTCGTRIAEAAGSCPICRRNMKKVKKIFTV
ncbi:E3 ubiquitin-protein ligase APD2 [Malania oleifera]|uniref:E3 ubiquitin-protein ligase APD2 n=1 Tax=Malania oleifera TaxID=397392 RepID=UPI0025AE0F91|nr:E3 ubiquitin-protein ligase APD2 [Malania oleifera]